MSTQVTSDPTRYHAAMVGRYIKIKKPGVYGEQVAGTLLRIQHDEDRTLVTVFTFGEEVIIFVTEDLEVTLADPAG